MNKIIHGDALTVLKTLPEGSINCCMTSPPYFNQRDYGVEGQLGLEKTPEEYIAKLCDIFDEVKRVLRNDGTCWVNIGDCYGGYQGKNNGYPDRKNDNAGVPQIKRDTKTAKSLMCVPELFLMEMIKRGWLIRNKIVWYKPNVMPSSAKDRFTIDYEMLYFFTKNKDYYFEQQYEPIQAKTMERNKYGWDGKKKAGAYSSKREPGSFVTKVPYAVQPRDKDFVEYRNLPDLKEFSKYINEARKWKKVTIEEIEERHKSQAPHHWFNAESFPSAEDYKWLKELLSFGDFYDKQMMEIFTKSSEKQNVIEYGRNKRTVWKITTKPSKEGHYAMYPEELCEIPLKAGCPLGGVVLDPFAGTGTTGIVARKQNKNFIGIELNSEYCKIAEARIKPYLEQEKL